MEPVAPMGCIGWHMRMLFAVGFLLLAAACGSAQTPPSAGRSAPAIDPSDPCALLTSAQMANALGLEVGRADEIESIPDPQGNTVPLVGITPRSRTDR
jgi:hypothetical protein